MSVRLHLIAISSLLAVVGGATSATADQTGVASIHEWRRFGDKTCFVDHTHEGSGSGSSQKAAMGEAIDSWQQFTALEYGTDWGSYARSINKTANCSQASGGFSCHVESIPCMSGSGGRPVRRSRR